DQYQGSGGLFPRISRHGPACLHRADHQQRSWRLSRCAGLASDGSWIAGGTDQLRSKCFVAAQGNLGRRDAAAHSHLWLTLSRGRCAGCKRHGSRLIGAQKSPANRAFSLIMSVNQAAELIHEARAVLGAAPTLMSATSPFLKSIRVGMERTPKRAAIS